MGLRMINESTGFEFDCEKCHLRIPVRKRTGRVIWVFSCTSVKHFGTFHFEPFLFSIKFRAVAFST